MGLRIIYGRSGTGKSLNCFKEIARKIEGKEKIYIITPEQFSFTAEKKLLENIEEMAVINAEVLTFQRMAYRIINEVGGAKKINLSKCGRAMIIYNILLENKEKFNFLGKSDENVDLLSTAITELKKHNILVENLENMINKEKDNRYLKAKLNDLKLVYENFEKIILDKYIDEDDILNILYEKLDFTKEFENTKIYIDEFVGFTEQEYKLIEKLSKQAKEVTITVNSDNLDINTNPDIDIFYTNKQTSQKLKEIAKKNKITINEIGLNNVYRFKNEELKHLEENIYNIKYKKYEKDLNNIQIFLANNLYSEIEYIGKQIIRLVRDEGYKFKDIGIITKNLDTYANLVKSIFNKFEIPVFIDEKKDLSQNILVKYILALIDIFSRNWTYESMFNYIKSGLVDIDEDDLFLIENYAIKWGIKGKKWETEWRFGEITKENEKEILRINELRKEIITPLLNFRKKLEKNKTARQISKAIYEFLVENKIDKVLQKKIDNLLKIGEIDIANQYSTSWKVLLEVLDEIVMIFENEKQTFEKYGKILKIGLSNKGLRKNSWNM